MIEIVKKLKLILNKKQRIRLMVILLMMIIGAGLETIGVSLIIPLVSAIVEPDVLMNNHYINVLYQFFGFESITSIMIILIVALIFIFIFKNLFLYFEYYVQYRFIYKNRFSTQRLLLETYLHRPYEYFLHAKSGEIMRVVLTDTNGAYLLLTGLLNFFTELMVSILLVILLFVIDPVMTLLVAAILLVLLFMIAKVVKPILKKAGKNLQSCTALSYQWVLQAITGIKDLKVAQKEKYFLDQYSQYGNATATLERKYSLLNTIPRLLIEAVSVSSLLLVILLFILNGKELSSMLPQLAAFAFAAVRLLPSTNRLSAAYNSLSFNEPSLDKLIENIQNVKKWEVVKSDEDISNQNKTYSTKMSIQFKNEIDLSHITYIYPQSDQYVFHDASLVVPIGKTVGIVGVSGAGKTTVVDILLGLLELESGKVLVDGIDINDTNTNWLDFVGYIPQSIFLIDGTIRENIAFGVNETEISDEKVWSVLKEANLADFISNQMQGLDSEIGERGVRLSGGQRQRLGIARALYTDPAILVFDEATSALDNDTEKAIMESVNNLRGKKTIIIIAHRLETIVNCDLVYRVVNGTIQRER